MPDGPTVAIFLLFLSTASAACAWWWWLRLPEKFPPPKLRNEVSFGALVSGTMSTAFPFISLLWPGGISEDAWSILFYLAWGLGGLAFVLSFFGRGKLRIAEMIMGLSMCPVYWQLHLVRVSYM